MNIKKDLPVYVLSGAIILSTLIYTSQGNSKTSDTKEQSTDASYVTLAKYKADIKLILTEVLKLQNQVGVIEICLEETTGNLTRNNQVTRWCP